jgi:hypothetical protein
LVGLAIESNYLPLELVIGKNKANAGERICGAADLKYLSRSHRSLISKAFYLPDQGTDKINIDGAFHANEMNKVGVW